MRRLKNVFNRKVKQKHRKRGKLSNIPSPYGLCQGEVDAVKRGPKLNLIKNLGKGGGRGGGVILQL